MQTAMHVNHYIKVKNWQKSTQNWTFTAINDGCGLKILLSATINDGYGQEYIPRNIFVDFREKMGNERINGNGSPSEPNPSYIVNN